MHILEQLHGLPMQSLATLKDFKLNRNHCQRHHHVSPGTHAMPLMQLYAECLVLVVARHEPFQVPGATQQSFTQKARHSCSSFITDSSGQNKQDDHPTQFIAVGLHGQPASFLLSLHLSIPNLLASPSGHEVTGAQ